MRMQYIGRVASRRFVAFVAGNPNLAVFLVGFLVFCVALARYSRDALWRREWGDSDDDCRLPLRRAEGLIKGDEKNNADTTDDDRAPLGGDGVRGPDRR
jgi:hypothetical protein